jgi:hypothetical protein
MPREKGTPRKGIEKSCGVRTTLLAWSKASGLCRVPKCKDDPCSTADVEKLGCKKSNSVLSVSAFDTWNGITRMFIVLLCKAVHATHMKHSTVRCMINTYILYQVCKSQKRTMAQISDADLGEPKHYVQHSSDYTGVFIKILIRIAMHINVSDDSNAPLSTDEKCKLLLLRHELDKCLNMDSRKCVHSDFSRFVCKLIQSVHLHSLEIAVTSNMHPLLRQSQCI